MNNEQPPRTETKHSARRRFLWLGRLGAWILRAWAATWRIEWEIDPASRPLYERRTPILHTFWHEHLLPLAYAHRGRGIVVLVSESSDGEIISQVLHRLGYGTARGSSSRGGRRAFVDAVRAARSGRGLAISPDGPRGPRQRLQPGALLLAARTQLPLVPLSCGARPCRRLRSWDRFQLPWPFARLRIVVGPPIQITPGAEGDDSATALDPKWEGLVVAQLGQVEARALRGLETPIPLDSDRGTE